MEIIMDTNRYDASRRLYLTVPTEPELVALFCYMRAQQLDGSPLIAMKTIAECDQIMARNCSSRIHGVASVLAEHTVDYSAGILEDTLNRQAGMEVNMPAAIMDLVQRSNGARAFIFLLAELSSFETRMSNIKEAILMARASALELLIPTMRDLLIHNWIHNAIRNDEFKRWTMCRLAGSKEWYTQWGVSTPSLTDCRALSYVVFPTVSPCPATVRLEVLPESVLHEWPGKISISLAGSRQIANALALALGAEIDQFRSSEEHLAA